MPATAPQQPSPLLALPAPPARSSSSQSQGDQQVSAMLGAQQPSAKPATAQNPEQEAAALPATQKEDATSPATQQDAASPVAQQAAAMPAAPAASLKQQPPVAGAQVPSFAQATDLIKQRLAAHKAKGQPGQEDGGPATSRKPAAKRPASKGQHQPAPSRWRRRRYRRPTGLAVPLKRTAKSRLGVAMLAPLQIRGWKDLI